MTGRGATPHLGATAWAGDRRAARDCRRAPGRCRRARSSGSPEYRNQDIVRDVFDHVDAIVVPSVWVENSPLVIHEAQQARVPVITADVGGMAEYVEHEENGLLFAPPRSRRHSPRRCSASPTTRRSDVASAPAGTSSVRLGRRARYRGARRRRSSALYDEARSAAVTPRASRPRPGPVAHHLRHEPGRPATSSASCAKSTRPHSLAAARAAGRPARRRDAWTSRSLRRVLAEAAAGRASARSSPRPWASRSSSSTSKRSSTSAPRTG